MLCFSQKIPQIYLNVLSVLWKFVSTEVKKNVNKGTESFVEECGSRRTEVNLGKKYVMMVKKDGITGISNYMMKAYIS